METIENKALKRICIKDLTIPIKGKGYQKILNGHTYTRRFSEIFNTVLYQRK
jgi:hypothetical protein